jgi:hypothetical protein
MIKIIDSDLNRTLYSVDDLPGWAFEAVASQDDVDPPWQWSDCHGTIRTSSLRYSRSDKRSGEVVLHEDRSTCWIYDFRDAVGVALRDGWGVSPEVVEEWKKTEAYKQARKVWAKENPGVMTMDYAWAHGFVNVRAPKLTLTKGQLAVLAVNEDMKYLRDYLRGDWYYLCVKVQAIHAPSDRLLSAAENSGPSYLGGVDSNSEDSYLHEIWKDLAHELAASTTEAANEGLPEGMTIPGELDEERKQEIRQHARCLRPIDEVEVEPDAEITATEESCPAPGYWVQSWLFVPA